MKFFVDTADTAEIAELAETGLLDGVTTNPSLIHKAGRDFIEGAPSPAIQGRVSQALNEASLLISARSISAAIAAE